MVNPHESLINVILDLYSEKTGAPVTFIYENKVIWSSKKFCSPYCKELNKLWPGKCLKDHIDSSKIKEEKIITCHAGLWNFVVPINRDGTTVGTLLIGQKRLQDRDPESKDILKSFGAYISKDQFSILEQSFDATPIITKFDTNLLRTLDPIEERLFEIFFAWDVENRRFSNFLAHVISKPCQLIILDTVKLYELSQEKVELKEKAKGIMEQTIKLYKVAKNIMEINNEKYNYEMRNILDILNENINLFRNEAIRKNIEILNPKSINGPFPELPMSYDHLSHAFYNLIDNAIKYSRNLENTNNCIEIIGKHKYQNYTVEITNYGIGILKDEIKKGDIYKLKQRGKLADHYAISGAGIGLPLAKEIIEKHGGKININSILLGNDELNGNYKTTVDVSLPKFRKAYANSE